MKLTCSRASLATAFGVVSTVIPSRTPRPILQNVKLQMNPSLTVLIATDQELGIRYVLSDATIEGAGEVLLPASRVISILRELRDESVTLDIEQDSVCIRAGGSEFKLPVESPEEFPTVAEFNEDSYLSIGGNVLKEMIRRTIFATDPESSRYALGGILLDMSETDRVRLVATDSRRLAIAGAPCTTNGKIDIEGAPPVIPAKTMSLLEKSITDGDQQVNIALHPNQVLIQSGSSTIYSRLVEGRFPRFQDVVPSSSRVTIDLNAGSFYSVVRQAQIVTSEESRGVDFTFQNGSLILNSQAADIGQSRIELPISYSGDPFTITFDPRFVSDFLKVLGQETPVKLELTDSESAALLKTDDGYLYVIMPLSRDR
ncbi:MAG: DNA polymerase III subunit beta [Planctomycetaceae bacterium]|nr:DNA polymerase III subunit beta [Planctomycetaceae bacterium]